MGVMYATGEIVDKDREKAIFWLTKAAGQGHKDAIFNLKKLKDKSCIIQ